MYHNRVLIRGLALALGVLIVQLVGASIARSAALGTAIT